MYQMKKGRNKKKRTTKLGYSLTYLNKDNLLNPLLDKYYYRDWYKKYIKNNLKYNNKNMACKKRKNWWKKK